MLRLTLTPLPSPGTHLLQLLPDELAVLCLEVRRLARVQQLVLQRLPRLVRRVQLLRQGTQLAARRRQRRLQAHHARLQRLQRQAAAGSARQRQQTTRGSKETQGR